MYVNCVNGVDGLVIVRWCIKDLIVVYNKDYIGGEGMLMFEYGEISKIINFKILEMNVSVIYI